MLASGSVNPEPISSEEGPGWSEMQLWAQGRWTPAVSYFIPNATLVDYRALMGSSETQKRTCDHAQHFNIAPSSHIMMGIVLTHEAPYHSTRLIISQS